MIPAKIKVADNIRLSYIHTEKFKVESVSLFFELPFTPEDYILGQVLSGIVWRGCERIPTIRQMGRTLDELYSSSLGVSVTDREEMLCFRISVGTLDRRYVPEGKDILRDVLTIASDILLRPILIDGTFDPETVKKSKENLYDDIKAIKNNTKAYASMRLHEMMTRNYRFAQTYEQKLEYLDTVDTASVFAFYQKLISSSRMSAFYVGSQGEETVASLIKETFADFVGRSDFVAPTPAIDAPEEFLAKTEELSVTQGKLAMGFRTGASIVNGEHATLALLSEILGGSPASKLFLNVREKLSLCYYCSSGADIYSGTLTVNSGLDNANREIAEREILAQLECIRRGEISEEELEAARQSFENTYSQIYDSPRAVRNFYLKRDRIGSTETIEQYKQKLLSVTVEDVCALAQRTVYDTCFFIEGVGTEGDGDDNE